MSDELKKGGTSEISTKETAPENKSLSKTASFSKADLDKSSRAEAARAEAIKNKKAEQSRKTRRRNRQLLGLVVSLLVVIGVVSIVQRGMNFFEDILDNATEREEYKQRIETMVWFDFLPFEDVRQVDQNALKQISIWSIYNIKDKDGNFVRNEQEEVLISEIEVNRQTAALMGNNFRYASHGTFTEPVQGLTYEYDDSKQAYAIPITGIEVFYYPRVVNIEREDGGKRRVTVGYLPATGSDGSIIRNPEEGTPAKYMDYIFQRDGSSYYLVALERNTEYVDKSASASSQATSSALAAGDSGSDDEAESSGSESDEE